jgi:hypothetical protein
MKFGRRVYQLGLAVDQTAGTVVGLFLKNGAWADETLSARCWREHQGSKWWNRARVAVDLLFFWQKDHCHQAFLAERDREHMPIEYRDPGA